MPGERVNDASKRFNRKAKHSADVNQKMVVAALAGDLGEDLTYGVITRVVGNGRVRIKLANGLESTALIRKSLRSKRATGMGLGDVVIVGIPNWEKEAVDRLAGVKKEPETYIEGLLTKAHASTLRDRGEIPEWMLAVGVDEGDEGGEGVGFEFDRSEQLVDAATDDEDEDEDGDAAVASATNVLLQPKGSAAAAKGSAAAKAKWTRSDKRVEDFNVDNI
jgi:translation initiation factor IF-1